MISRALGKATALAVKLPFLLVKHGLETGRCPLCGPTIFFFEGSWLRDQYRCARCYSIPRWRALIHTLETYFPEWRNMTIHESSPGGAASRKLKRECAGYSLSHYFPGVSPGDVKDGILCQDLQALTFPDNSFDILITQDVFEHLPFPVAAFREIARVLRPGGAHVFTVPLWRDRATLVRAEVVEGEVRHLLPPEYHGNPIDPKGSLVFREWGGDISQYISRAAGLQTDIVTFRDRKLGLDGEMLEVLITRKPL